MSNFVNELKNIYWAAFFQQSLILTYNTHHLILWRHTKYFSRELTITKLYKVLRHFNWYITLYSHETRQNKNPFKPTTNKNNRKQKMDRLPVWCHSAHALNWPITSELGNSRYKHVTWFSRTNQRPCINHVTLNNQSGHKSLGQDGRGLVYRRKIGSDSSLSILYRKITEKDLCGCERLSLTKNNRHSGDESLR